MVLPDIVAYLETQGIGTRGTNLFYGILPDTPDACVVAYEYGGLPNEPNLGKLTTNLEFPRIQVVSRGVRDDYDTPRLKVQNVITALTLIANQTLSSGISYKAVQAIQPAFFLMRDDNFRVIIACNFQVTKQYSTS